MAALTDQTYPANVEITAKVRVDAWTGGPSAMAGVAVNVNSAGLGYGLVFHDGQNVEFIDNGSVIGSTYQYSWNQGQWYWFQLEASGGNLYGNVWADGSPEPSGWQFTQSGWSDHASGSPALVGGGATGASSSTSSFDDLSVTPAAAVSSSGQSSSVMGSSGSVLAVHAADPQSLTVSWTPVAQAAGYVVERANNSSGPWIPINETTSTTTSIENTGLLPSTSYSYEVIASLPDGSQTLSATATASTNSTSAPSPTFSDSFDNSTLASGWNVENGTWTPVNGVLTQTSTVPRSAYQAVASSLTDLQNYDIKVKVRVDSLTGALTNTLVGVGLDAQTNAFNRGYALTLVSGGIMLSDYAKSPNGVTAPFSWKPGSWYWLELSSVSNVLYAKAWSDGSPAPSTWQITQSNWGDQSGSPALWGGTTGSTGASTASFDEASIVATSNPVVDQLTAKQGSAQTINLSWTKSALASEYVVERSTSASGPWTPVSDVPVGSSALVLQDSGLAPSTTYTYRIVTVYQNVVYGVSNSASASTSSSRLTGNLLGSDGFDAGGLSRDWTFPNGGSWNAAEGNLEQTQTSNPRITSAVMSGQAFPANAEITAKVRVDQTPTSTSAYNIGVGVDMSSSSSNGYYLVFSGPNKVAFEDGVSKVGSQFTFNWSSGTWYWFQLEYVSGVLYGKIWKDGASEPTSWQFTQKGWNDHSSGAPGLVAGFTTTRQKPVLPSSFDDAVATTTSAVSPPNAYMAGSPGSTLSSAIVATATANQPGGVDVSWTATPGASSYEIERATSSTGPFYVVGGVVQGTSYEDTLLNINTTYYYRVYAKMPYGSSLVSSTVSARTSSAAVTTLSSDAFLYNVLKPTWLYSLGAWSASAGVLKETTGTGVNDEVLDSSVSPLGNYVVEAKVRIDVASTAAIAGVALDANLVNSLGYRLILSTKGYLQILDPIGHSSAGTPFSVQVGAWYWLKLVNMNGALYAQAWADGQPEPSGWTLTSNETIDLTSGWPALVGSSVPANGATSVASFTDYQASNATSWSWSSVSTPSNPQAIPGLPGQIVLGWTGGTSGVDLLIERSSDSGATWSIIGNVDSGAGSYTDSMLPAATTYMYRLIETSANGGQFVVGTSAAVTSPSSTAATPVFYDSLSSSQISTNWAAYSSSPSSGGWTTDNGVVGYQAVSSGESSLALPALSSLGDQEVVAKVRLDSWTSGPVQSAGVGLRSSASAPSGYGLLLSTPGYVQFVGPSLYNGNSFAFNWTAGSWYWMALKIENGTLYGKVWADGQPEPADWPFEQLGWNAYASGSPALIAQSGWHTNGDSIAAPQPIASFADASVYSSDPNGSLGVPLELSAVGGQLGQTTLVWTAPSNATGFIIQQSPDGSTGWVETANEAAGASTLVETGLTGGATYYYRIAATTLQGQTGFSNVASVTVGSATTPAPLYSNAFNDGTIPAAFTLIGGSWTEAGLSSSSAVSDLGGGRFTYTLAQQSNTSAGVYNAQGALVKQLWSMETQPEGVQTAYWDGYDQFGRQVARRLVQP